MWFNGRTRASQARDGGSIPLIRSIAPTRIGWTGDRPTHRTISTKLSGLLRTPGGRSLMLEGHAQNAWAATRPVQLHRCRARLGAGGVLPPPGIHRTHAGHTDAPYLGQTDHGRGRAQPLPRW